MSGLRYLLDTNAVISMLNEPGGAVAGKLRTLAPAEVALSSVVMHELYFGAFKSQRVERNVALVDHLGLDVLAWDREDARAAGEVRARLVQQGQPIGPYDVLIAGQALAQGLVLVTRNVREFERVPGLQVENWQDA